MGEFKVGDKVKILNASEISGATIEGYKNDEIVSLVKPKLCNGVALPGKLTPTPLVLHDNELEFIKLVKIKPSKKQRIETLEKEVSELKLIVHELRERKVTTFEFDGKKASAASIIGMTIEPSTDEVIEFEGAKYRKVDREAREGDVVVLNDVSDSDYFEVSKPYKVQKDVYINGVGKNNGHKEAHPVYREQYNRTPETVDVYELITEPSTTTTVEGKQDVQRQTVPCAAAKTPNQLRAEVIEKAVNFVDENGGDDYHFEVDEEKRTVFAYKVITSGVGRYGVKYGFSQCHPNDVFNADIGKAISFGRAKKLDVSEFEQAVQPSEPVVGMEIQVVDVCGGVMGVDVPDEVEKHGDRFLLSRNGEGLTGGGKYSTYRPERGAKIINDTNAIYGGVE